MKKFILAIVLGIFTTSVLSAQNYRDSKYYNPQTGRLDYSSKHGFNLFGDDTQHYLGFRIGPSIGSIHSSVPGLNSLNSKTGLNLGVAFGTRISNDQPAYLETGLYYTEKGCKFSEGGHKVTTSLDYLEIPLTFKYRYAVDDDLKIEPFFGGFFALGVGGPIKSYDDRTSCSSFNNGYKRCDAGLKFGCGMSYDMFYVELGYDLGLANVYDDDFDSTRTGAFQVNFGVNF